jgi:vitamin B12 transporter
VALDAGVFDPADPPDGGDPRPVEGAIDVSVRAQSVAERMQQSSEAVQVVELANSRRQAADLGEVLARTQGVGVRRTGGLGSNERISLNGFSDDQVRVFVDGLPIEYTGFGAGLANIPINLLERVEIYRGVVPIRFGADALGGALNVVTKLPTRGRGGHASLLLGSFGTERVSAGAHQLHRPSGFLARVQGFLDHAKNDYPIRIDVPSPSGQSTRMNVYRRHDAYRSYGGGVDLGFVRRPWAERLLLKLFASTFDKEIPHNLVMTQPYGEARWARQNYGANLHYAQPLTARLRVEAVLGYGLQVTDFRDKGEYLYNWFGQRQRMLSDAGEIEGVVYDTTLYQHGVFGRAHVSYQIDAHNTVRASFAPNFTTRSGEDRGNAGPSQLDGLAKLTTMVTGVEHALTLFDERLENTLFGKVYLYRARIEELLDSGLFRERDRQDPYLGGGDAVRFRIMPWLYVKGAYEYAVRTPRPDELFGDGALVFANLNIQPERSHNVNFGVTLLQNHPRRGSMKLDLNGFDRHARDLIYRSGSDTVQRYRNVGRARSTGLEVIGSYSMPGDYLSATGNLTYFELINQTNTGADATTKGDRVPNLPYLFANAMVRGALPKLLLDDDSLSLTYYLRYVHGFYRTWESQGDNTYKQTVDKQLSHTLSLTYLVRTLDESFAMTVEVQNLTDARLYDVFGAQRPGRGYYAKVTADF